MKISINKILSAAVIIIMIAFVLLISIRQTQRIHNTAVLGSHTELILTHIQNLTISVLDNKANVRGYVIEGKDQFLELLQQSGKNIIVELELLKKQVAYKQTQLLLNDSVSVYIDNNIKFVL
jgi:CHASE3 domain sensor protein